MNAAQIAHALGDARREGRGWRCRCPLHGRCSLTLRDGNGGRLLAWCFGGCASRDVLAELRRRGLLDCDTSECRHSVVIPQRHDEDGRRIASARRIWDGAYDRDRASLGPIGGGAVRLGKVRLDTWLCVAEGIETALAVSTACGIPAWAGLSAGGIRALVLPPEARMVLICADNDANGVGQRAAADAAQRWLAEGRRVRIAMPPESDTDMADVLVERGGAYRGGQHDAA